MPAGGADTPAGGDEAAPAGDESPLLAVPPGSRNDVRTYEKSTYTPVKRDRRKDSGPRMRNYAAQYNKEKRGQAQRARVPGAEINSLSTAAIPSIAKGIYEDQQPTYILREHAEEAKLLELNESVKKLIEGLENTTKPTEQDNENKA